MEGDIPFVAEAKHIQRAALRKIAADLLRDPNPDMLHELLGTACMRRDLGDGLEDEAQIADGDPFGQEKLQDGLKARIGDLRRADVVEQPLVLGIEPIEQVAHILVGEKLRQVVADDLAQMGEQHRGSVDGGKALPLDLAHIDVRHPHRLHAEGRLAHLVAGHIRNRAVAEHHEQVARTHSCVATTVP